MIYEVYSHLNSWIHLQKAIIHQSFENTTTDVYAKYKSIPW